MSARAPLTPHLLGRADELAALERFLAEAWPGVLVLEGPAGIGKTALWSAGIGRAEALGVRVWVARVAEPERDLAFAGLELLVSEPLETHGDRLAPHRRAVLEAALLRGGSGGVTDVRSVGLAVADLLAATVEHAPLLLALDDLPWLDPSSATVLAYALRRLGRRPVGLLATARTGDQGATDAIGATVDEARRTRLPVRGLSLGAVGLLLQERLDLRMSRPQLVRLYELSTGNPLTALELGRAVRRGDPLTAGWPQADLLQRRLAALSADARLLLAVVGATGGPTMALVERVLDEPDLAVGEAVAAGVVTIRGDRLVVEHPLMGSIGYELVAPTTRRRLHARLAEHLETPEQRAVHLALATVGADAEVAARLEEAAASTAAQGTPSRAAELAGMAAVRTPATDPQAARRRRLLRARLHVAAGELAEATAQLDELLACTPAGQERVAPLLCRCDVAAASDDRSTARACAAAALEAARGDRVLEARCHAAIAQSTDQGVADELAHAEAVLALVQPDEEPTAVAQALTTIVQARLAAGEGIDDELFEQALALDPLVEMRTIDRPGSSLVTVPRTAGDLERARRLQLAAIDEARRRGDEAAVPFQLTQLAGVELRHGDVAAADRCLDEAEELAAWCGLDLPIAAYRAWSAALAGRFDEADDLAGTARVAAERGGSHWLPLFDRPLGLSALQRGDVAAAAARFEAVRQAAQEAGVLEPAWFATDADLVEALLTASEHARASAVIADLDRAARIGGLPWTRLAAARCRLLVADDLDAELRRVEASSAGVTSPYERARTSLTVGRVLQRRCRRSAARAALVAAEDTFADLGLAGFAELARRELGRLGGRVASGNELTSSERQVAELAAGGLTNREIGARLFLSVRTVESHLSAAYRKLGVRSRTELARALPPDA